MITRLAKFLFYAALLVTVIMAILPHPPRLPLDPSDKQQHMLAFGTLAALGAVAFRSVSILWLVAGLILLGAAIEVVQAIPVLNRDSDIMDIAADAGAVLVAACLARLILWRHSR